MACTVVFGERVRTETIEIGGVNYTAEIDKGGHARLAADTRTHQNLATLKRCLQAQQPRETGKGDR